MSHLERVSDGADEPRSNSNYPLIIGIVVAVLVVLGLALFWGGYMNGSHGFNMMGFTPTQVVVPAAQTPAQAPAQAPAAQGAPGAAGAAGAAGASGAGGSGGSGGAAGAAGSAGSAGAAGSPGAPGATGAQGATTPSATP